MGVHLPNLIKSLGPTMYYRLGEASGTSISDSGGNGRSLALASIGTGSPTLGVPGGVAYDPDTAINFPGNHQLSSSSGVTSAGAIASASGLNLGTLTTWSLSLLFKPTAAPSSAFANIGFVAGVFGFNSARGVFYYDGYAASNLCGFVQRAAAGAGTNYNCQIPAATFTPGEWHHVVGTFDGTTMRTYVNNVAISTLAATVSSWSSSTNFAIGAQPEALQQCVNAAIDEVAHFDYALSVAQILALYNAGKQKFIDLNRQMHQRNWRVA